MLVSDYISNHANHHDDRYVCLWRLRTFIVLNYLYKHLQTFSFYFKKLGQIDDPEMQLLQLHQTKNQPLHCSLLENY